ncbi:MAG: anion permease [Flavobacteriales bacterium]|nr:anion permease [Flavobacteriales bacterium]MBK7554446.1 anion permease [Flavobacteriales bacterium]MBK9195148.1 anion permease [Flavobacteriales bacterium]
MSTSTVKSILLRLAGPALGLLAFLVLRHLGNAPAAMAGVVLWMAVWWISETVPLAVTALLPLVLFPMLGIASTADTALNYGKDIIFLFLGGFLLALGIERSGLHKRAALWIIARVGAAPSRLLLGVMLGTALLSMWINSTAAVLVMLPIALGLVDRARNDADRRKLGIALLLGVSYGATIGGMSTPVGTPPNLVFMELSKQLFPGRAPVGFGQWMTFGVPLMLIYLAFAWTLLHLLFTRRLGSDAQGAAQVQQELKDLGQVSHDERFAALFFILAAVLWITGGRIEFSTEVVFEGWRREGWGLKGVSDAAVAIACSVPLFLVRSKRRRSAEHVDRTTEETAASSSPFSSLLPWHFAQDRIPWGVLLLIGGGLALASGFESSGLAEIIGNALAGWNTGNGFAQVGLIAVVVTVLSELGSNTAVAGLALPLLASAAPAWGMEAYDAMIPGTLAASCGFMLPISSPMMAIVFGTGRVPVGAMLRTGIWMDLAGVVLLALWFGW